MIGPLLTSKYRLPRRLSGGVPRQRLLGLLGAPRSSPLTLISAPAGFGKTTLLAEWLDAGDALIAWVSLDPNDNDPIRFWTYVVTALQTAVAGIGGGALQVLASSSAPADAALVALVNDLDELSSDLVLVLDDYHVIETADVHSGMTFLLEHQPPRLHIVIATRVDPPLPLAHLRVSGRLSEARAAELRFSPDEAREYLNGRMDLQLTDTDVATLEQRTEGWIAALQLAALSLQGRDDPSGFIAGFAGDDRYVVDYLAEQVLGRQSAQIRHFLLNTSILERLTGSLCDAVTGAADGQATLVALERANLFLVPLDDRRQWYRYHHLFADVLRAHLFEDRPGAQVAELHRSASAWFDAHGDTTEAISHALAGGDLDRAAALMELAMPTMRRERREAEVAHWIRAIPDEMLRSRPVLDMAFVGALAQALDFETISARLDRIDDLVRPPDGTWPQHPPADVIVVDEANFRSLPAHLEMYRAAVALSRGELDATIAHARRALSLAPAEDALARSAAGALAGLALWSTGELSAAHAAYSESAAGLAGDGFGADVLGCTITLGDIRRTQGRLSAALRTYQDACAADVPGQRALGERPTCTSAWPESCSSATTSSQLASIWRPVTASALRTACHRTLTAGGWSRRGCGKPRATWTARSHCSTRQNRSTSVTSPRMCSRSPPSAPDCTYSAANWLSHRHGYATANSPPATAVLPARVRTPHPRPSAHRRSPCRRPSRRRAHRRVPLLDRLLDAARCGERGASVLEVLVLQAIALDAGGDVPAALDSWAALSGSRSRKAMSASSSTRDRADRAAQDTRQAACAPAYVFRLLAAAERQTAATGALRIRHPVERARTGRAAAARRRSRRSRHRPHPVRVGQHPAHAHQEHLHQARRDQPARCGTRRPRAAPDPRPTAQLTREFTTRLTTCGDDGSPHRRPRCRHEQHADQPPTRGVSIPSGTRSASADSSHHAGPPGSPA